MDPAKLENFKDAFSDHSGHCRFDCNCGKTYFDNYNHGIDWEDGELEKLQAGGGTPVDGSVGGVMIEGRAYAENCTCWHKRAEQVMGFIDGHANQIAAYLTKERERKQAIADSAPVVG